jgi:hypothetical protein
LYRIGRELKPLSTTQYVNRMTEKSNAERAFGGNPGQNRSLEFPGV